MDTIPGCTGGDACPLVTDLAANTAIFETNAVGRSPNVYHLLPKYLRDVFTKPVCEAIVGIATAPANANSVDFGDEAYNTCKAVVEAAFYGHATVDEASLELNSRMEDCEDEMSLQKIKAAIELLKSKSDCIWQGTQGVFTFIWAKLGDVHSSTGLIKLQAGSASKSSSVLSATIKRPKSAEEFFEMLHDFCFVVQALGLVTMTLLMSFLSDVVYRPIRSLKEKWQIAHELLLVYFKVIEEDSRRRLNFGNVFRDGGSHDTYLQEARLNAETFFRSLGGTPRGEGSDVTWNGKFDSNSKKACVFYNQGKEHSAKYLNSDGSCPFNHKCNQWVSGKGPYGMCWADHPKTKCTCDASIKLKSPQK